jgi:hypothetical protein
MTFEIIPKFLIQIIFFQVFGNDDTQCPDKSGGKNVSRLYIDSSEPSPGGTGKWTKDDTLTFECKNALQFAILHSNVNVSFLIYLPEPPGDDL